jgi:hypothetical protein
MRMPFDYQDVFRHSRSMNSDITSTAPMSTVTVVMAAWWLRLSVW